MKKISNYQKFYEDHNWNACIALLLGWECEQSEHNKSHFRFTDSEGIKYGFPCMPDYNELPQWDTDKNLWVEGNEVVEWMRKDNDLFEAWLLKLDNLCWEIHSDPVSMVIAPALDYTKSLATIGLERMQEK